MDLRTRPIDFRALRELIDAREVMLDFAWKPLSRRGDNWRGPCPFHGSTFEKSVSLSACRSIVRCFKCRWQGDGLQVWLFFRPHAKVLQAAYEICERFHLQPPYLPR